MSDNESMDHGLDDEMLDEIIGEFLIESSEALDQLDQDLVTLEDNHSTEVLASIFRTMHTIKGTCGFLGFGNLESLAHTAENLLSRLRDGELQVTAEITTALLLTGDAIREMMATVESTRSDGTSSYPELVNELLRLQQDEPETNGEVQPLSEVLTDYGDVAAENDAAAEDIEEAQQTQTSQRASSRSESTIRVDVELLDDLMNLVGELVLARNEIVQLSQDEGRVEDALSLPAQRLNLITTELQEGVMRTRMQPIGNVWNRFPRVVRDLARASKKMVHVEMEGSDTELDKTIVEAIKDPLTHLVRNSVDHGIESPEERQRLGKPAEGVLSLRAFHEGGQVIIEISDDGAGINVDRVAQKAIEKGLIEPDAVARMSQRELVNLIFTPGFSTAAVVTNVSGRGVGMDVVRTNIERIGGSLDVTTEAGVGSTFRVKIPLTLAIIPALMVGCGDERFAIPQVSLLELVRLENNELRHDIEWIHGAPVFRLRGRLLPLVDLSSELGLEALPLSERRQVNLVVLQSDNHQFGLIVDSITDTQEIVVKPLSAQLHDVGTFAGATIMGDGRVALILDILGLAQRSAVVSHDKSRVHDSPVAEVEEISQVDEDAMLVVGVGGGQRAAVALSTVSRLEQIPNSAVEYSSRGVVVQYRGELLPLVSLAAVANVGVPASVAWAERGNLNVVVWGADDNQIGLVVDNIIDIVNDSAGTAPRLVEENGSASFVTTLGGEVTDVIDIDMLLGAPLSSIGSDWSHDYMSLSS
ncbi:MAG: chemotaxis protein CheW [Acidimicrobiia bacterium]